MYNICFFRQNEIIFMLKTHVLGKTGIYKVQYSGNFSRKGMLITYNDGFSEKLGTTLKKRLYLIMPSVP